VIFVHGCFWHRHKGCKNAREPKTNKEYWIPKFKATKDRDLKNLAKLYELGWKYLVIWECQIKKLEKIKKIILEFLEESD